MGQYRIWNSDSPLKSLNFGARLSTWLPVGLPLPCWWIEEDIGKVGCCRTVRSTPRTADQETEVQPSFEVDLEERQHRGLLRQMIERLPEDYRIPIVLHYFEEQSIKEMSEFMEQPETTVKWRLHKGREMLLQEAEVRGYRTQVGSGE